MAIYSRCGWLSSPNGVFPLGDFSPSGRTRNTIAAPRAARKLLRYAGLLQLEKKCLSGMQPLFVKQLLILERHGAGDSLTRNVRLDTYFCGCVRQFALVGINRIPAEKRKGLEMIIWPDEVVNCH